MTNWKKELLKERSKIEGAYLIVEDDYDSSTGVYQYGLSLCWPEKGANYEDCPKGFGVMGIVCGSSAGEIDEYINDNGYGSLRVDDWTKKGEYTKELEKELQEALNGQS